jgi:hypothetical protein
MEDFVTVGTYFSMAEAEPPRLALESAGIPAMATDENIGEMLVPVAFGGIKLQVSAQDAERAKEVLAEFTTDSESATPAEGESDDGISLKCPKCEADIWFPAERLGHVEVCPECGAYVDVQKDGTGDETAES